MAAIFVYYILHGNYLATVKLIIVCISLKGID